MDASQAASSSTASAGSAGGSVEPVSRAAVTKERFQTPPAQPGERYELRDPFADVTYRSSSLAEMVSQAERLGSTRFTALAADGKRTPIIKAGGAWQRASQLAALPERPLDPTKDEPEPQARSSKTPGTTLRAPTPAAVATTAKVVDIDTDRAAYVAQLNAALGERYIIKRAPLSLGPVMAGHTEYRFRGDTSRIAFTESTFRLATDTNSPSVARSMVDVAQARSWKGLRVAGNEDFRRLVWLEASVRGVKALGYEPNPADLEVLKREREARQVNRIEPTRDNGTPSSTAVEEKSSVRGGGRKAVIAAMEAVLVAKGVPEAKRVAVLAAATEQLAQRTRAGQTVRVKVYDKAAPAQRQDVAPIREVGRARERAARVQVR